MNKGLVYSYMRFSDPKQAAGDSRARQLTYAAKWASSHGLPLDENLSMQDEGLSAYHQHHVTRGALGAFLAAVEAELVPRGSFLIVEGLDRLSRAEPILAQAQLAQIINAGISVVTASDGKVYSRETLKANPMDLVYSLLVMIRAHEESETKSSRVKAAIRRQCEAWQAGTFRGQIRNGTDPSWVRWNGNAWELIEERAAAVRYIIELYRRGMGGTRIVRELLARGMSATGGSPDKLFVHRLIKLPALIGDRELTVGDKHYLLKGYYPPLISDAEWLDVQKLASQRGLRPTRTGVPNIITGLDLTKCGYCGAKMVGQNNMHRRRQDGVLPDFARRLGCYRHLRLQDCPHGTTASVAPVERALMAYCSDMLNLQALQSPDRSAGPRAELARASAELSDVERKLERLVSAMLDSADAPEIFVKRARELETAKKAAISAVAAAEQAVAAAARIDITGEDSAWRQLAHGVMALDETARLKARQLVADTFERITVWIAGITPGDTPAGSMDVMLTARGGMSRMMRIDASGGWVAGEAFDAAGLPSPPLHSAPA